MRTVEDMARWHQALTFALTGRRQAELGEQSTPVVRELADHLRLSPGRESLLEQVRQVRDAGLPWPHPVPEDLMDGLGPAQFAAALTALRTELGLNVGPAARPRVGEAQALSADDRRLLADVPPHHGS